MKKLFLLALVCCLFAVGTANAQNENYYGAQKGSWAVTVSANPIINFIGNIGSGDNYLNNLGATLGGKYFIGDKFALTAGVGFNNYNNTYFYYENIEDTEEVTRKKINGDKNFSFNLGAQYNLRQGKRLQPFLGASIMYERGNISTTYKAYEYDENGVIEQYNGKGKESYPTNTFGIIANLGIEYFIGKNVSISAALDLGVKTSTNKHVQKLETEDPDATKEYIDSQNYKEKISKNTTFGTGLMNGNIAFNFYF